MGDRALPQVRIGICGSASVGKTSLANALARDLNLPCLREEMRDYLEDTGACLRKLPAVRIDAILLELLKEREQKETLTPAFVADTCPLDFAAHALYYGCLGEENADIYLSGVMEAMARYDALVVLPWGALCYEIDGVRVPNQHLELPYQFLIEDLLRRYIDPEKLYFLPASITQLDDRRRWTLSVLRQPRSTRRLRSGHSLSDCSEHAKAINGSIRLPSRVQARPVPY